MIVTQTNLYVQQFLAREQNLSLHFLAREWKPTDRAEMLSFFGIIILMGILHKPRLAMYWSFDTVLSTPIFKEIMDRDRFLNLLRFPHFADNRNHNPADPDCDRLYKIRKIINMMKQLCREVYSPGKDLSVNESLVLFKGRLSFM